MADEKVNTGKPKGGPAPESPPDTPNLTRDGIELHIKSKLLEQGKSESEATATAKKRAREMIP